jgi:hypothetical protein
MEEYRARLTDLGDLAVAKLGSGKPWSAEVRQSPGGDVKVMTVTPPVYVTHEATMAAARLAARSAFAACSVLEHRATTTGAGPDASAYFAALGELDTALTRLWDAEETGAARKRVDVEDARLALRARAQELLQSSAATAVDEGSVRQRHEARSTYADALSTSPLPDNAIDMVVSPPAVVYEDRRANAVRRATGKVTARVAGKVAARAAADKKKKNNSNV